MISFLISTFGGAVAGLLQPLFQLLRDSQEHKWEMQRMEKQSEIQLKMLQTQSQLKVAEIDAQTIVEQIKSMGEQMKALYDSTKPIGVPWVDAANAFMRPFSVYGIFSVFLFFVFLMAINVFRMYWVGAIDAQTAFALVNTGVFGELVIAISGFLFGNRSVVSLTNVMRR